MNALEYAIQMEIDGEKYYGEQARLNHNNSIVIVSRILEKAERRHELLLRSKLQNLPYSLSDDESYMEIKNVFNNIGNFKSDIRTTPNQLEFYRHALEIEKQSIDLYVNLLNDTSDKDETDLFQYLIDQENLHFRLIDEIVTMLRHAEEWVESAEFGLRKETY